MDVWALGVYAVQELLGTQVDITQEDLMDEKGSYAEKKYKVKVNWSHAPKGNEEFILTLQKMLTINPADHVSLHEAIEQIKNAIDKLPIQPN